MPDRRLTVALISEVFTDTRDDSRLQDRLAEARDRGARLAVLPELPLNDWAPWSTEARDEDAESPGGPRATRQAVAAAAAGIGLVGGAIVRDPATGTRRNTALVFDNGGNLVADYAKVHLPQEPGFWETSHYEPGEATADVVSCFDVRFGVQICSDIYRPQGTHLLAGLGAEFVVAPRATEAATWERWRVVFRANALTGGLYVLSVNRPTPEHGVELGGPSIAVGPDGGFLLETTDPVGIVTLDAATIERARSSYPGYLPVRSDLYAEAWARVPAHHGPPR